MARKKAQFGPLTEENVDEFIELLKNESKGNYIVQSVAFSKTCTRSMAQLRAALLASSSFGGLMRELIALYISGQPASIPQKQIRQPQRHEPEKKSGSALRKANPNQFV